jgi:hypothetical protein
MGTVWIGWQVADNHQGTVSASTPSPKRKQAENESSKALPATRLLSVPLNQTEQTQRSASPNSRMFTVGTTGIGQSKSNRTKSEQAEALIKPILREVIKSFKDEELKRVKTTPVDAPKGPMMMIWIDPPTPEMIRNAITALEKGVVRIPPEYHPLYEAAGQRFLDSFVGDPSHGRAIFVADLPLGGTVDGVIRALDQEPTTIYWEYKAASPNGFELSPTGIIRTPPGTPETGYRLWFPDGFTPNERYGHLLTVRAER